MKIKTINEKRGLSPVIATVILIGVVLLVASIAFVWFNSTKEDLITKFGGTNVQLVCKDVSLDSEYSGGELSIANNGNVPVYKISVKIESEGSYQTVSLEDFSGLNQGGTYSTDLPEASGAEKIILIPILLGESENGKQPYVCEEDFGTEIILE